VVSTYEAVEAIVRSLGRIEIVARERYVLFRTTRIFADLVIMTDAVRVAVHLKREVADPIFIKVVHDKKRVTLVAKLSDPSGAERLRAYLKEAYEYSLTP